MTEPAPARITRLDIEGFRVIDKLSLELRPMNVLIGENGSGKSTVLEALELLRKAASMTGEQFLNELYTVHGGVRMFRGNGSGTGQLLRLGLTADILGHVCKYSITLRAQLGGSIQIAQESIGVYDADSDAHIKSISRVGVDVATHDADAVGLPSVHFVGLEGTLISIRRQPGDLLGDATDKLRELLSSFRVFPSNESNPAWARRPNEPVSALRSSVIVRPAIQVERGGTNLPNVYFALRNRGAAAWERTLTTIQLGLGDEVEDLKIEASPSGGEVGLSLVFRGVGDVPAFMLSDGQLSYLMFVAVTELERNGLVAFDEPDVHLHPALIGRVADLAEEMSQRRTVVIATHSDRFLDALSDPAESVILFERARGFRTQALRPNRERLQKWLERYSGLGAVRAEGYSGAIFSESDAATTPSPAAPSSEGDDA